MNWRCSIGRELDGVNVLQIAGWRICWDSRSAEGPWIVVVAGDRLERWHGRISG